jgi:hypothetical protein
MLDTSRLIYLHEIECENNDAETFHESQKANR